MAILVSKRKTGTVTELVKTVLYAMGIALIVRTLAYEPFNIPSGSMIPTLLVGDFLFVSKFSYGYSRHSLPFSLPLIPGRILMTEPERGDVVVFKVKKLDENGRVVYIDFIKRLVGLPGDEIQVVHGILHINGAPVQRERVADFVVRASASMIRRTPQYTEILPNNRRHSILEETDEGPYDMTPVYKVPEGHFFMMGDNRDNSADSRADIGFVPKENLVGRAEFLFFSIDGSFAEFWNWPHSIRFSRLFKAID